MKYVLFLDIDGVLHTEQSHFYWEQKKDEKRPGGITNAERLCPIGISNLNYLCKQVPGLSIVISSTWRTYFSVDELKIIFTEDGFRYPDRIVDITPVRRLNGGSRELEIATWLEKNSGVEDWVAVDDREYEIPKDHLILTLQEDGFNIFHAYQIVQRFKAGWERPLFLM